MGDRTDRLQAFLDAAGWGTAERRLLAADASFRHYDRLTDGTQTAVLMNAPPDKEDVRPFVRIARHLTTLGFSAPAILAEDVDHGFVLLEDLGDSTYARLIASGEAEAPLYALAVDMLIDLHRARQATDIDVPPYDDKALLTEAALLPDWFLPAATGRETDASVRESYLDAWAAVLSAAPSLPDTLVLRDFHVDNLMRLDGRDGVAACGLLDFQDALIGPVTYDLVSLLEDARRDIDPALIADMRDRYLAAFPEIDRKAFDASWAILAAQRHAKVIGIFTRLNVRDGKNGYLPHIPRVWRLLSAALQHPALDPVSAWLDAHIPSDLRTTPACLAPS